MEMRRDRRSRAVGWERLRGRRLRWMLRAHCTVLLTLQLLRLRVCRLLSLLLLLLLRLLLLCQCLGCRLLCKELRDECRRGSEVLRCMRGNGQRSGRESDMAVRLLVGRRMQRARG